MIKQDAITTNIQIDIAADPSPVLYWTKDDKDLLNVDKFIQRIDQKGGNKHTASLDIKVEHLLRIYWVKKFSYLYRI